ncbi:MAG: DUF1489 domain-containing protein [Aestuariivita sp.]|nr:DUF1489 domain-containing protein [Aestuariivita sp.]
MTNQNSVTSMADAKINLIKLCVGAETVEDLIRWQATPAAKTPDGLPMHVTRMWPQRSEELLQGGSLYWVVKGLILCRQKLIRLDKVIGDDSITRCGLIFDPTIIRTRPMARRPFQGWRYFYSKDAPKDVHSAHRTEVTLPEELNRALNKIGVI